MKKIIIVGAGRFGYSTAKRLSELGARVTVIDTNEKRLEQLKNLVSCVFVIDAIDREAFEAEVVGGGYDAGVVAIGDNFTTALLVSLYLKQFGVPRIVARASNPKQGRILIKIGVDLIVTPEDEMGHRLAERLILADSEQIDLSSDTSVVRVVVPKRFVGKTLGELAFKGKGFDFLFAARTYTEQGFVKIAYADETDFRLASGDYLLFAGETHRIASFVESAN